MPEKIVHLILCTHSDTTDRSVSQLGAQCDSYGELQSPPEAQCFITAVLDNQLEIRHTHKNKCLERLHISQTSVVMPRCSCGCEEAREQLLSGVTWCAWQRPMPAVVLQCAHPARCGDVQLSLNQTLCDETSQTEHGDEASDSPYRVWWVAKPSGGEEEHRGKA